MKEHPHQWRRLYNRPRNYWRRIASIPKVRVVPHGAENSPIIRKCEGLVSISHSTLGVEAWAIGKRVVFLGDSHLREAPGISCTSSAEELRQLWRQSSHPAPSDEQFYSYLQRVERATFEGALYGTPRSLSPANAKGFLKTSQHNIAEVIICWLSMKGLTNYP